MFSDQSTSAESSETTPSTVEGLGLGVVEEEKRTIPALLPPEPPTPKSSASSSSQTIHAPSTSHSLMEATSSPTQSQQPLEPLRYNSSPTLLASPPPSSTRLSPNLLAPAHASHPTNSSANHRTSLSISNPPAPFDLPTRSDVLAAAAVHRAEEKKMRGGWVMGGTSTDDQSSPRVSVSKDGAEAIGMVEVDLEGGLSEKFGGMGGRGAGGRDEIVRLGSPSYGYEGRRSGESNGAFGGLHVPMNVPLPLSAPPTPLSSPSLEHRRSPAMNGMDAGDGNVTLGVPMDRPKGRDGDQMGSMRNVGSSSLANRSGDVEDLQGDLPSPPQSQTTSPSAVIGEEKDNKLG